MQHGDGLWFAESKAACAPYVANHIYQFGFGNGDGVVRENLDVILGILGLQDLFQTHFRNTESSRRINLRIWQRDATPFHLAGDPNVISRIRPGSAGKGQHLEQRFESLHLMNTRSVYLPENRDRLARSEEHTA